MCGLQDEVVEKLFLVHGSVPRPAALVASRENAFPSIGMLARIEAKPRTTIDTLFDAERFPQVPHSRGKEFLYSSTIHHLTQKSLRQARCPSTECNRAAHHLPTECPIEHVESRQDLHDEQRR